jgi:RNA polymerase sigma-70 factor (ECF subfamily)
MRPPNVAPLNAPDESTRTDERRRGARGGLVVTFPVSAHRTDLGQATDGAALREDALLRSLVERVKAGDLSAFDRLYQLTREEAARVLIHLVGREAEVEDLLQDTYLRLLKAVKTFRGESRFRTFLYRVCANVAFSHLRWWRRRNEEPVASVPDRPSLERGPEDEAFRREAGRLVALALEGLTARKRIVFVYHEMCGMGPEEIAQVVGASPNTVRSRLHHARLEFNDALKRLLGAARPGGADALRR